MTTVDQMTKKEMLAVKRREWRNAERLECDAIVIIPGNADDMHDSGYRRMYYLACKKNEPLLLCGGGDVFHLEGIGGYGLDWILYGGVPDTVKPSDWSIDCLPKSGLLRLFTRKTIICERDLSSMEIYSKDVREK